LLVLVSNTVNAQHDIRELVVDYDLWEVYSLEELAGFFADGLSREDAEDKESALAGVLRLAMAAPYLARSSFDLDVIESLFDDSDTDVLKNALAVYVQLAPDDSETEVAVVERARKGGGPLRDWEYIRYLRPLGITSEVAQTWLLELATGPVSESKYSAARALVAHMENPPQSLLPEVMQLIRSPEYFCDAGLTQHIPRFGASAVPYLGELRALRVVLLNRIGTTDGRTPSGHTLQLSDVEMIDKAINAFEN
jgi:hypothetical protein